MIKHIPCLGRKEPLVYHVIDRLLLASDGAIDFPPVIKSPPACVL